ncbi:MAG: hypothetical protein F4018_13850 [Acidobacteria bacterium]|nr:hypothetical protein [Acidobacteriota bacterium]MYH30582.1 hypothetical protein [Acidobacteriota bacterium]MYK89321.1 hypothetical protein [Acidobacteriota bacterium]
MQKLTDSAKLSEQLTRANQELARLRAAQERAARAAPGATCGTWAEATRKLQPADRARIADAIHYARNIFRWARRRNRLENTRWQRGDPGAELRTLVRRICRKRRQRNTAA